MALNVFSNGLRLVCLPKRDKKIVCVALYIAGGTQSEKNYQSGISEYLTKILLMGTRKHSSREMLSSYAKSYGVILNAQNSKESIVVTALCPKENVDKAIEILSEIAFETNFSLENGERARKQQLSQVSLLLDNPQYIMDKLINTTLYYRTGLANPKHGTNITISRFRAIDAKDFLEKIRTPRNTIISVTGDVDQAQVYQLVKTNFFERMKAEDVTYKKLKYVSEVSDFVGCCKGRVKNLNQTRINIAFPTYSFKDKEKYVIEIVKPILINHIKESLSNIEYYFDTKIETKYYANNGNLVFEIFVDYEYTEEFLDNFVEVLDRDIKQRDISRDEFDIEKRVFLTNFMHNNDDVMENAIMSARSLALTKQTFSENTELLKIEVLTNKDANKVIRNILDFEKMLIVYMGQDVDIDYDSLLSLVD